MTQLIYNEAELLQEHAYASPHEVLGYRLHGGFDEEQRYISPRMKKRGPAVKAWQAQLKSRGWPLISADTKLLTTRPFPSAGQQKLLLQLGLGRTLWNSLSITGIMEGRGRMLMQFQTPDFQEIVTDDLQGTATGHLNKGLLSIHGMDEGGDPNSELGGHDTMWFAARDLLFGADAYPIPEPPESIARPDSAERLIPQIPAGHEAALMLLMNVLMIEVRAELVFTRNMALMRDGSLFTEARANAETAAELVARIRMDEQIHVDYLRTIISEMRSFTFKSTDGGQVSGDELIDPAWESMVHWHAEVNPRLQKEQLHPGIERHLLDQPNGEQLLAQFNALDQLESV